MKIMERCDEGPKLMYELRTKLQTIENSKMVARKDDKELQKTIQQAKPD